MSAVRVGGAKTNEEAGGCAWRKRCGLLGIGRACIFIRRGHRQSERETVAGLGYGGGGVGGRLLLNPEFVDAGVADSLWRRIAA